MGQFTKLYQTGTWKKLRLAQLRKQPFCCMCEQEDRVVLGTTVDHKIPHKGNMELFVDQDNLQTLCSTHHSKHKQLQEIHGFVPGSGEDGLPLDPNHPFRTGRMARNLESPDPGVSRGGRGVRKVFNE